MCAHIFVLFSTQKYDVSYLYILSVFLQGLNHISKGKQYVEETEAFIKATQAPWNTTVRKIQVSMSSSRT